MAALTMCTRCRYAGIFSGLSVVLLVLVVLVGLLTLGV